MQLTAGKLSHRSMQFLPIKNNILLWKREENTAWLS